MVFEHMQDYTQVYLNGTLVGTLNRTLHQDRLPLKVQTKNAQLDVLVENSGRVNFTPAIRAEWKGIRGSVTFAGNALNGWSIYNLPMTDPSVLPFSKHSVGTSQAPTFYRGSFPLQQTGDTFLDMRSKGKGIVWVNGHLLGRFWDIGPQRSLYVPGPWLKSGQNTVVIFDLLARPSSKLSGLSVPVPDKAAPQR